MLSTIGCIASANYLNKKAQSSLLAAYTLLDKSYKEYVEKSNELYGEDAKDKIISEIAKDNCDSSIIQNEELVINGEHLFFDYQTLRWFNAKIEDVLKAEAFMNEQLAATGYVSMVDFYKYLDLEYDECLSEINWCDNGEYMEIVFYHQRTILEDGMECFIIIADNL